jgi:hypothetical protein
MAVTLLALLRRWESQLLTLRHLSRHGLGRSGFLLLTAQQASGDDQEQQAHSHWTPFHWYTD